MLTCCMFDAYMLYVSIEVSLHVSLHVSIHVPVLHVACHVKSSFLWLNNWPHSQFNFCLCCAQRQSAYHRLVRVDLDQAMWPHMASTATVATIAAMDIGGQDDGQHSWIHAPAKKHHTPSVTRCISVNGCYQRGAGKNDTPFQRRANSCHHKISLWPWVAWNLHSVDDAAQKWTTWGHYSCRVVEMAHQGF